MTMRHPAASASRPHLQVTDILMRAHFKVWKGLDPAEHIPAGREVLQRVG